MRAQTIYLLSPQGWSAGQCLSPHSCNLSLFSLLLSASLYLGSRWGRRLVHSRHGVGGEDGTARLTFLFPIGPGPVGSPHPVMASLAAVAHLDLDRVSCCSA